MKNVIIGIFASLSVILSGYVIYDTFIKEEPEILMESKCEKCICEENNNYIEDNEGTYTKQSSGVYTQSGKIHKLDIYQVTSSGDIEFDDIKINNKAIKIVIKNDYLYINDKKYDYSADHIYVTNDHAYLCSVGQNGLVFQTTIDSTGNVTDLHNNKTISNFQTDNIYLNESGDLIAIGSTFCGLDCTSNKELVKFSYSTNESQITKEKLK